MASLLALPANKDTTLLQAGKRTSQADRAAVPAGRCARGSCTPRLHVCHHTRRGIIFASGVPGAADPAKSKRVGRRCCCAPGCAAGCAAACCRRPVVAAREIPWAFPPAADSTTITTENSLGAAAMGELCRPDDGSLLGAAAKAAAVDDTPSVAACTTPHHAQQCRLDQSNLRRHLHPSSLASRAAHAHAAACYCRLAKIGTPHSHVPGSFPVFPAICCPSSSEALLVPERVVRVEHNVEHLAARIGEAQARSESL